MGFFQVAAITILYFQVKQKYLDSMDSISYWLYFGVTVWNVMLILGITIFMSILNRCLSTESSSD